MTAPASPRQRLRPGPAWVVVGAYVVSRLVYAGFGVRFLYRHAPAYHHFIDVPALEHHLFQSLWYDHAQPPGLNLLWGVALRLSPAHPDRVLWPVFLAAGLGIAIGLYAVGRRLGLGERAAAVVAVAWTVSPGAVLLETYLFYTPFEILGLLAVAVALARWHRGGTAGAAVAAVTVASALALTRASFHLVWVAGLVALFVVVRRDRWRVAAAAAVIPLILVGGWYTKNLVLFDQFGATSWTGANLNRITTEQLPEAERRRLAADGSLSPYAPYPAFSTFSDMGLPPTHRHDPAVHAPVLDDYVRHGAPPFGNVHQRDYLDVNQARMDDARWTLRHRPGAYARGVNRAASLTFWSSSDYFGYGPNVDRISAAVTVERFLGGGTGGAAVPGDPHLGDWSWRNHEWLILGAYLVVLVGVPARLARRRAWRAPTTDAVVAAYLWGTVTYLTVLGTLIEFGENNRFRSVTDPAVLLLAAWLVTARRPRPDGDPSAPAPDAPPAGS